MNAPHTPDQAKVEQVKLLIDGQWVESKTTEWRDIVNPATQQVLARVPFATVEKSTPPWLRPSEPSPAGATPPSARVCASCSSCRR